MNGWAISLVSLAIVVSVVFPLYGLWKFNPVHARGLKSIEKLDDQTIKHINEIRLVHPEIMRVERLDRHPTYVGRSIILLLFGIEVFFVTVPYGNLGAAALNTQYTLAVSLVLAATMTLTGSIMGLHWQGRCIGSPEICSNVVSSRLGDDIRWPYVLGWWGQVSALIGLGFYVYTVVASAGMQRLLTTYGGIVALVNIPLSMWLISIFIRRLRRYIAERDMLIAEGLAIMAAEDRLNGR